MEMIGDDDRSPDWSSLPALTIESTPPLLKMNMNGGIDHQYRDWSLIPWKTMIRSITNSLNAVDHVRFRSVCSHWRRHAQERQKAPLVILIDRESEEDTIKALSFFDIIGKAIIPLRPLAFQRVANSYYLGSSRGWIFVGTYTAAQNDNQEELRITLLNPFTDGIINLPMLSNHPRGRVFLLNSPRNLQMNHELTVVYYVDTDYLGLPNSKVNFIELNGDENQWVTFWLDARPSDVIAVQGLLCANYYGLVIPIDLDNRILLDLNLELPGLLPILSSDPALFLRFFVDDLFGKLHLLFTNSYRTSSYCFLPVSLRPLGPSGMLRYNAPIDLKPAPWFLHIKEDFSVVPRYGQDYVHVDDYYPFRLLLRLSMFWSDGQNQWEPVGWITPVLL